MDTSDFITTLRREGTLLADAAGEAGLDAPVPPCPEWRVRDLLTHTGAVHRWATSFVLDGHRSRQPMREEAPDGVDLLDWYRQSHSRLTDALTAAPADLDCWYFLPAPSPRAFWARRQAHETTIHRVDAEAAAGAAPGPIDSAFAADGVDELLAGFQVRRSGKVRTERPSSLRVRTLDVPGGDWLMRLSAAAPVTERGGEGEADCTVSGPAVAVYLALWNRAPFDGLTVAGDDSLVELWRRSSGVN
jgi:uncharacterized protein (TIGR03083 family)